MEKEIITILQKSLNKSDWEDFKYELDEEYLRMPVDTECIIHILLSNMLSDHRILNIPEYNGELLDFENIVNGKFVTLDNRTVIQARCGGDWQTPKDFQFDLEGDYLICTEI